MIVVKIFNIVSISFFQGFIFQQNFCKNTKNNNITPLKIDKNLIIREQYFIFFAIHLIIKQVFLTKTHRNKIQNMVC